MLLFPWKKKYSVTQNVTEISGIVTAVNLCHNSSRSAAGPWRLKRYVRMTPRARQHKSHTVSEMFLHVSTHICFNVLVVFKSPNHWTELLSVWGLNFGSKFSTKSHWTGRDILRHLWNHDVHHRAHNISLLIPFLSQVPHSFFMTHLSIILPFTLSY